MYYRNLHLEVSETVYEPAEDSFLLADNLLVRKGDKVLDVGTGSGIIALAAAEKAAHVIGVDVNPEAVACARKNAKRNGIRNAEFRVSNLFENVSGKFDAIAFNPPYLPGRSVKDEAVDGGAMGRALIEAFIKEDGGHLKPDGRIFLLASSLNEPAFIIKKFAEEGFRAQSVAEKKLFFEKLVILSAKRQIA